MGKDWDMRTGVLALGLCGLLLQVGAVAMATSGSEEAWERHLDALERIEAIADPLERCLAMPGLPESDWPEGLWRESCRLDLASLLVLEVDDVYRMLDAGEVAELDALFRSYRAQDEGSPEGSVVLRAALSRFRDPAAAQAAERWARAAPESAYALAAAAISLEQRGWRARGTASSGRTSALQFREMRRFMDAAQSHAERASAMDPRLIEVCLVLARIGRADSRAELRQRALDHCLEVAPNSFAVRREIQIGAEPRWGGSLEDLASGAGEARQRVVHNPLLERLARDPEVIALRPADVRQAPDQAESLYPVLRPEALASPNQSIAEAFISTARRTHHYRESVAFLTMALLRDTDEDRSHHELYERGVDLQKLGRHAWSLRDWDLHVEKVPTGSWNHFYRGEALFALERHEEARGAYEDAYRYFPDSRLRALERLFELEYHQEEMAAAELVLRRLLRLAPENARYWFTLASLLYDLDRDGFTEAADRFAALAPPDPANAALQAAHATMADMRAEWGRRRIEGPPEG